MSKDAEEIRRLLSEFKFPGGYVMDSMLQAITDIGGAAGGIHYRLNYKQPIKLGTETEFTAEEKKKMQQAWKDLEQARKLVAKAIKGIEKIDLGYSGKEH